MKGDKLMRRGRIAQAREILERTDAAKRRTRGWDQRKRGQETSSRPSASISKSQEYTEETSQSYSARTKTTREKEGVHAKKRERDAGHGAGRMRGNYGPVGGGNERYFHPSSKTSGEDSRLE